MQALRDISISIDRGQVFGLLGSNGAGKTTLVKLIAGLITADSGKIQLFNEPVDESNLQIILSHVGLVTNNERTFYWRLSGRQNLEFFAILNDLSPGIRKKKICKLLNQLELDDIADRPFMTYSTGQKQRFAIARSLLNDPRILLFDEATANLDPLSTKKLLAFVKNILVEEKRKTIVWCTHNLAEAERVCDNIAILHEGRMLIQGTLEELQHRLSGTTKFSITVRNWRNSVAQALPVSPVSVARENDAQCQLSFQCREDELPPLLRTLLANGVDVFRCARMDLQLEEIFEKEILRKDKQSSPPGDDSRCVQIRLGSIATQGSSGTGTA